MSITLKDDFAHQKSRCFERLEKNISEQMAMYLKELQSFKTLKEQIQFNQNQIIIEENIFDQLRQQANQDLFKDEKNISQLYQFLQKVLNENEDLLQSHQTIQKRMKNIQDVLEKSNKEIIEFIGEHAREISKVKNEVDENRNQLNLSKNYKGQLEKQCQLIKQEKQQLDEQIKQILKEIQSINLNYKQILLNQEQLNKNIQQNQNQITESEEQIYCLDDEIKDCQQQIKIKNLEIEQLRQNSYSLNISLYNKKQAIGLQKQKKYQLQNKKDQKNSSSNMKLIGGGTVTGIGILLTPFTFGLSLGLCATGGGVIGSGIGDKIDCRGIQKEIDSLFGQIQQQEFEINTLDQWIKIKSQEMSKIQNNVDYKQKKQSFAEQKYIAIINQQNILDAELSQLQQKSFQNQKRQEEEKERLQQKQLSISNYSSVLIEINNVLQNNNSLVENQEWNIKKLEKQLEQQQINLQKLQKLQISDNILQNIQTFIQNLDMFEKILMKQKYEFSIKIDRFKKDYEELQIQNKEFQNLITKNSCRKAKKVQVIESIIEIFSILQSEMKELNQGINLLLVGNFNTDQIENIVKTNLIQK